MEYVGDVIGGNGPDVPPESQIGHYIYSLVSMSPLHGLIILLSRFVVHLQTTDKEARGITSNYYSLAFFICDENERKREAIYTIAMDITKSSHPNWLPK